MSQTKRATSPQTSSINPVLRTALASLDLNLEAELRRYQDYKRKKPSQNRVSSRHNPVISPKSTATRDRTSYGQEQVASLVHQPNLEQLSSKDDRVPSPEDYLKSSEKLLLSLAEGELLTERKQLLLNPVATPLGTSSMFIFLLAAALFSLAFIPSEIFPKFPLLASLINNPTDLAEPKLEASAMLEQKTLPQNPNLAVTESVELNLQNLSTLKAAKTDRVDAPSYSSKTKSSDLTTALIPSSLEQTSVTNTTKGKSSTYYYVLADYNGDKSLAKARKIVADAYVWQFPQGKRIQLGAFYYQAEAARLVSELKAKGILASVYHPHLQDLSTVKTSASDQTDAPSSSSNTKASDLTTALIKPDLEQKSVTKKTKGKSSTYYFVLADYNGDESLAKARKIVDDAYVWKFPQGKRIQLGAFYYQTEAARLVSELKAKGISASVYHPEN